MKNFMKSSATMLSMEMEEVKSEYLRSLLLVFFFSSILIIASANYLLMHDKLAAFYGGAFSFFYLISFVIVFIVYQLINVRFLKRRMRESTRTSFGYKMLHTTIDVSFPSVIMVAMMHEVNLISFLDSPVVFTYFLFIILSVLHLDFRVNIFTGILVSIEYSAIAYYAFNYMDSAALYKTQIPENSHYLRSVIFILSGGAAAFVSMELKGRMKSAFDFQESRNSLALLFGQQVSREVSQALIEEKGVTRKREATVMFLDIRNFTAFADTHAADEVIDYQNKFLSPVIDIINLHQGVVFQILGDGLMACFGAPVENALHADMAFQASVSILRQVRKASDENRIPGTRIGIGLHSGLIVTGNIGSEQRKQFSISGTPVIVAARIEQLNKKYGTEFLISHDVFKNIVPGKVAISHLGQEPLRGIEKPVDIYKVVTHQPSISALEPDSL